MLLSCEGKKLSLKRVIQYILFKGDDDIEINGPDYDEDPSDLQILQDVGK